MQKQHYEPAVLSAFDDRGSTFNQKEFSAEAQFVEVNFSDSQLQKSYDLNLAAVIGSSEVRQVCALIAVHDFFQTMEGPHSARVHEIMDRLLSPGMRASLRDWYHCRPHLSASAIAFRDQLTSWLERDSNLNPFNH